MSNMIMCFEQDDFYHLTYCQKQIISFKLFNKMTHKEIVELWNIEFHDRVSPLIQTVYKIRNQLLEVNCLV